MKDLYARLGLQRTASDSEIAERLQQRPELQDAASILLDAKRRSVYDRAHANLKLIGELRRRLRLDSGGSWFVQNHADFASKPSAPSATAPESPERGAVAEAPRPAAGRPADAGRPATAGQVREKREPLVSKPVAYLIVTALVVLALLAYFWIRG